MMYGDIWIGFQTGRKHILWKPYLDTYDVMDQASLLNKLEVEEIMELVDKLSKIYNVSNEMMINRLKSLNYLN